MEPADFRLMVESRGLRLISSHSSLNNENLESSINHAAEAGLEYIVIPSLPGDMISTVDGVKRAADFMNRAGFMGREFGVKIGFHNHLIEFQEIEGEKPYDILLNNTEKDLVVFELDLAWITAGGADPLSYFKKNPGRFEIWHVKDLSIEKEDATLGEGTIDFTPIFAAAEGSGMKYFFIEQDNCVTHTPLESIEISRNYLISSIL
jgi:sugar phosphate isomerase/epimerase